METDSSTTKLHRLILRHFPRAPMPLKPEMHLEHDLGGDSLNFTELIMEIETVFGISLPDREIATVKTVGQLDALVLGKSNGGLPPAAHPSHE